MRAHFSAIQAERRGVASVSGESGTALGGNVNVSRGNDGAS